MNVENAISQVQSTGYSLMQYDGGSLEEFLITLSHQLGYPVKLRGQEKYVAKLMVTRKENAHPASLSRQHGEGAFPFHTDTAHWQRPCRYVILACESPGNPSRSTALLPISSESFDDEQLRILSVAPFRIKNGRQSFFGHILTGNQSFLRFDQGCMIPANRLAFEALAIMQGKIEKKKVIEIEWKANQVAIVDNWRVLHGRSNSTQSERIPRKLLRVLVNDDEEKPHRV